MSCDHRDLAKLETLPNDMVQWICSCGRAITAAPYLDADSVRSFIKIADRLKEARVVFPSQPRRFMAVLQTACGARRFFRVEELRNEIILPLQYPAGVVHRVDSLDKTLYMPTRRFRLVKINNERPGWVRGFYEEML